MRFWRHNASASFRSVHIAVVNPPRTLQQLIFCKRVDWVYGSVLRTLPPVWSKYSKHQISNYSHCTKNVKEPDHNRFYHRSKILSKTTSFASLNYPMVSKCTLNGQLTCATPFYIGRREPPFFDLRAVLKHGWEAPKLRESHIIFLWFKIATLINHGHTTNNQIDDFYQFISSVVIMVVETVKSIWVQI